MNRHSIAVVVGIFVLPAWTGVLQAGPITVPNASFESPATTFVNINIDSWQKSSKPDWYNEGGGFMWVQLTGIFKNTSPISLDHIDNCDGDQALWLFAVPEVGLFQDYDSVDWDDPSPTHDFNTRFEIGSSYRFTIGIIGTGGNMAQGVTLELSLYYRDAASNKVTVAVTTVTNTTAIYTNNTHLIDFQVNVPTVKASDAWAGQNIGIQFLSTVTTNLQGGYWDLDNVRLSSIRAPTLTNPISTNGQFQFALQSEPGLRFEILATTNVTLPASNWMSLGTVTNITGTVYFSDAAISFNQQFYRARQLP